VAAQPFKRGQRCGQSHDAHGAACPQKTRQRYGDSSEDRKPRRQADHREWQQPAEGGCVDQKGVADPIEAGEKVAEAEPPADRHGRHCSGPAATAGAVD
jgi:hypothetical protein